MRTRTLATGATLALCAAAALVPAAASGGGASAAAGHTVTLRETRFHPANLTIRRGDTVTWRWRDGGTRHNVTFGGFHSRTQGEGSYGVRFNRRGTFNYHCTIHVLEGMRGKVVVR
jgi:plastocyanin